MREYIGLYKGKCKNDGAWIEGRLIAEDVIIPCGQEFYISGGWFDSNNLRVYEVDPDTIGECTGLRDKRGKLIFEGDILARGIGKAHVVKFKEGSFVLTDTAISIRYASMFEKIGNIYDNPELLKGGEG